jgi:hypothetical protein
MYVGFNLSHTPPQGRTGIKLKRDPQTERSQKREEKREKRNDAQLVVQQSLRHQEQDGVGCQQSASQNEKSLGVGSRVRTLMKSGVVALAACMDVAGPRTLGMVGVGPGVPRWRHGWTSRSQGSTMGIVVVGSGVRAGDKGWTLRGIVVVGSGVRTGAMDGRRGARDSLTLGMVLMGPGVCTGGMYGRRGARGSRWAWS